MVGMRKSTVLRRLHLGSAHNRALEIGVGYGSRGRPGRQGVFGIGHRVFDDERSEVDRAKTV